jgi:ornithine cyclodeaminase/alanine dehydrogenase-like protein (mu-crystallin family)
MNTLPHLDAGRIYRLAPFEEVVAELHKTFADPSVAPPRHVAVSKQLVTTAADQGLYVLLGDDGAAVATLDGAALTARRTPAVSALATDALARDDVRRLAVFGTGVQAREHVRAMRWIRPSLEQIDIVGHEPVATERFVAMLRGEGHPAVVASAADASSADLICTCTSSSPGPVLIGEKVSAGTHINTVGSHLGELLTGRVVDDLVALARGDVRRETLDEVTIFVAVEVTVEDLVVATLAARNAGLIS